MRTLLTIILFAGGGFLLWMAIGVTFPPQGYTSQASIAVKTGLFVASCLLLSLSALAYFAPAFNRLQEAKNQCDMAFSNIDVLLQRRHDLLDNLLSIVTRYASHENAVLASIAAHRSGNSMDSLDGKMKAAQAQYGARVHAVVEAYPELQASRGFVQLSEQLDSTENSIADERRLYNSSVLKYNNQISVLPDALLSKILRFEEREFFRSDKAAHKPTAITGNVG